MRSATCGPEQIDALFDELDAAVGRCSELPFDALTTGEPSALLERYELLRGRLAAATYDLSSPLAWHTRGAGSLSAEVAGKRVGAAKTSMLSVAAHSIRTCIRVVAKRSSRISVMCQDMGDGSVSGHR